jgi:ABC-type polysaccharide/polyol phosphate transport system ATPase subunit
MHAIEVHNVSKSYRIAHERQTRLAERFLSIFRPVPVEHYPAVVDVTVQVPLDSFVGVIGPNGSGKSTLLKLIAGLLVPDKGEIHVQGRIAPLLELGLGFHGELTAWENVSLYGALLGYPRAEMKDRVDAAIAFAEVERFRDAKLKSFSSGMVVRLAFATALLADADVLLLDEVLAVGDAHFQEKCFNAFAEMRGRKRTVVLVSHDLGSIQRFSDRVLWMDRGRLVMQGGAEEVVQTYLAATRSGGSRPDGEQPAAELPPGRFGDGDVRFARGGLISRNGPSHVEAGERVVLQLSVECSAVSDDPVIGFGIHRIGVQSSQTIYTISTELLGVRTGRFQPGRRVEVRMPFTATLMNGDYAITVAIAKRADEAGNWRFHDWVSDFVTFSVVGSPCAEGIVDLGGDFESEDLAPTTVRGGLP